MAESVTYADLRFVKAPLKKRVSSPLGQDPEADDDGELTYENVQVPTISGGASSLAASGPGDKAGVQAEPPAAAWSSVTSPAAWRLLGGERPPPSSSPGRGSGLGGLAHRADRQAPLG
uniref:CD72 molecule n=1 Tax=Pipistrellus kuhlii TaxID=59472 RepID=A0A7J7W2D8_PIPKU|nr:hypothetical protein mPipKuh1_002438 [Pipistrellus kuhlii]